MIHSTRAASLFVFAIVASMATAVGCDVAYFNLTSADERAALSCHYDSIQGVVGADSSSCTARRAAEDMYDAANTRAAWNRFM